MKFVQVDHLQAIVDDLDYDSVKSLHWTLHSYGYAVHKFGPKLHREQIFMHQLIAGHRLCDHKDRNKLNNQRINLRSCTHAQNHGNSEYYSERKTSKFKGVGFHRKSGKWRARCRKLVNGEIVEWYLGLFESEEQAARAYDKAALGYFKEFALTNVMLGKV